MQTDATKADCTDCTACPPRDQCTYYTVKAAPCVTHCPQGHLPPGSGQQLTEGINQPPDPRAVFNRRCSSMCAFASAANASASASASFASASATWNSNRCKRSAALVALDFLPYHKYRWSPPTCHQVLPRPWMHCTSPGPRHQH